MILEWLIIVYWHTSIIQIIRSSTILINLLYAMIQWKYIQTLLCNNANSVHSVIINIGTNFASMIKKNITWQALRNVGSADFCLRHPSLQIKERWVVVCVCVCMSANMDDLACCQGALVSVYNKGTSIRKQKVSLWNNYCIHRSSSILIQTG